MLQNNILLFLVVGLLVVAIVLAAVLLSKRKNKPKTSAAASKLATSLRDEKLKSNIILNGIEDGVVLVDEQQVIQLFNPGAAHISGWSADEAVGLAWNSVFKFVNSKGEPIESIDEPLGRLFNGGETIRDNAANIQTKSGKTVAINLVISPLLDDAKKVTGAIGVFRDVSQERQEEAQRAEFISTASHEMRTPVAAIEGYLALALNDRVSTIDARARDYLEKAHASTQHLGKLFQDLLTSAKAEDGRLTSHTTVIEFGSYLSQIVNDLKFSAEKKGLFLEFLMGSSGTIDASSEKVVQPLYYTHADPDRIREVITNIFDNAVKYTESGKVTIGLTGNDQVVQFYVKDTGNGIPAEDIPHLFQKFYRVDSSATRTIGGTGLGLFICRKIVELYDGRIWVESEVGKGSTFFINLPRLSTQKAEEMQKAEAGSNVLAPITSLTAS